MNFLKNTVRLLFVFCLVIAGCKISFASTVEDVPDGFWAKSAVIDCLNRGYFTLDSNSRFYPNGTIERAEFLNSLLKVIESEDINENGSTNFTDVNNSSKYSRDIAISQALGMIYGYPDKTFKPGEAITRSEATSVLATISRVNMDDKSILENFSDSKEIPGWALNSYAKAVTENLYVNYPDPTRFTPKSKMTRAEAAVLFAKMSQDIDTMKNIYKVGDEDVLLREETLKTYHKAPRNVVKIYNNKKVIEAGNIIVAHPNHELNTKTVKKNSTFSFVAPEDLYTEEGTLLYQKGAKFDARVHRVKNRLWVNKQNKALFIFDYAHYPNDTEKEMAAVAYTTNKGNVVFVKDADAKKKYKDSKKQLSKGDFLLKYVDRLIPVVKTKVNPDEDIYLLLTGDLIIPNNDNL